MVAGKDGWQYLIRHKKIVCIDKLEAIWGSRGTIEFFSPQTTIYARK